jgi:hypothetical protein
VSWLRMSLLLAARLGNPVQSDSGRPPSVGHRTERSVSLLALAWWDKKATRRSVILVAAPSARRGEASLAWRASHLDPTFPRYAQNLA